MLDIDTIGNYRKRYEAGGIKELLKRYYAGSTPMLSCAEIEEFSVYLETQTYLTVDAIVEYVKQTYQVNYSISGMRQLLQRLDFVYKKAKTVPDKANAERQQTYLDALEKTLAKKNQDAHYYLDGVHPQDNTQLPYGLLTKNFQIFGV